MRCVFTLPHDDGCGFEPGPNGGVGPGWVSDGKRDVLITDYDGWMLDMLSASLPQAGPLRPPPGSRLVSASRTLQRSQTHEATLIAVVGCLD